MATGRTPPRQPSGPSRKALRKAATWADRFRGSAVRSAGALDHAGVDDLQVVGPEVGGEAVRDVEVERAAAVADVVVRLALLTLGPSVPGVGVAHVRGL